MIGHRTRFRENGDLPPWRSSAAKKKPSYFNARADDVKLCAVGMHNAILGNDLNRGDFLLKIRGGPWTRSMGWSMDRVHGEVHGPRSMFCICPPAMWGKKLRVL